MFDTGFWTVVVGAAQTFALIITFMVMAFVAVQQLRAYVYPSIKDVKKFSLTEPIEITVELKNAGVTPARNCECFGVVFFQALPLPDDATWEAPPVEPDILRHSKRAIYPQGRYTVDCDAPDLLTAPIIGELRAGRAAIYVAGEAHYRDIFGFKRRSEFCSYIDPPHAILLIDDKKGKSVKIPSKINFVSAHIMNRFT